MIQEAPPLFKQDMCPQCWKAVLSSPEFQIFSKTFFGPDHEEKVLFPVAMVNHCSWVVYLWFVYFCICFLKLCFCFPKLFPDHKEKVLFPVVMVNHCSWVVYLWSGLSQIESAILSHAVTVDIKLRAQAKETVQNQAAGRVFSFQEFGGKRLPKFRWSCSLAGQKATTVLLWYQAIKSKKREGERCCWNGLDKAKPGMLLPAWSMLEPRWNLGSESEVNVSSVNLSVEMWIYCSAKIWEAGPFISHSGKLLI